LEHTTYIASAVSVYEANRCRYK